MHPRHDVALEIVLYMDELSGEITHMVVVDEGNSPDSFFVLIPFLPNEVVANQVTQGFRPIGIFAPLDVMVERLQQVIIEGDTETNKFAHSSPVLRFFLT
jgi:hypothetical protein